jgi:hypothetical protein
VIEILSEIRLKNCVHEVTKPNLREPEASEIFLEKCVGLNVAKKVPPPKLMSYRCVSTLVFLRRWSFDNQKVDVFSFVDSVVQLINYRLGNPILWPKALLQI